MLFGKYASRRSEAKYPRLWRGLLSAYCPVIQPPSGLRLYDFSGRNQEGAIADSGVWGRDSRGALISTATTQFTALPLSVLPSGSNSRSVSMWVRCTENARRGFLGNRPVLASDGWFFGELNSTTIWIAVIGVGTTSATVPSLLNRVAHVGLTHDATTNSLTFYCDGIPVSTTTFGVGSQSTAAATYLGREQQGVAAEAFLGSIFECATWSRVLRPSEMRLLALRPGILFDPKPLSSLFGYGFRPHFVRRQNQIIGGGLG
jgi:hypothetical protein